MDGIEIRGLTVAYGEKRIFDGLDLSLRGGTVNVVLGSSGVGKTTLLNAVAGLVPHGGSIDMPQGGISYIFQKDRLIPGISVRKNLDLVLRSKIADKNERREKIDEVLRRLEISDQAEKYPSELSGGQAQRVSMARAFLYPSSVLLMDEPFRALDLGLKLRLMAAFRGLLAASPRTVVYVTHDIDECVLAADRWILLGGSPAAVEAEGEIDVPAEERGASAQELAEVRAELFARLTAQNAEE